MTRKIVDFFATSLLFCLFSPVQVMAQDGFWHKVWNQALKPAIPQISIQSPIPPAMIHRPKRATISRPQQPQPQQQPQENNPQREDQSELERSAKQDPVPVEQASQDPSATTTNGGDGDVIIVPPTQGKREIPNFNGKVVAVLFPYYWRDPILEGQIREEVAKRGASFAQPSSMDYSGNPCLLSREVICVVIQEPKFSGSERGDSSDGSHGRDYHSSNRSSNGGEKYIEVVRVELWTNDGKKPQFLGAYGKEFFAPDWADEYYSGSFYYQNGGSYGHGRSHETFVKEQVVWGEAARIAKDSVKHLLKKKDGWQPGAAAIIRNAR